MAGSPDGATVNRNMIKGLWFQRAPRDRRHTRARRPADGFGSADKSLPGRGQIAAAAEVGIAADQLRRRQQMFVERPTFSGVARVTLRKRPEIARSPSRRDGSKTCFLFSYDFVQLFLCRPTGPDRVPESAMDIRRVRIRTLKVAFLAVVMSLGARTTASAGPLPLALDPYPALNAQTITSLFNASTGLFTANGTAVSWNFGGGPTLISPALPFKLTANFSGGQATSATLIIGSESSPYLAASGLIDFAYSATKGGTIEFLFDTVSGSSGQFTSGAPLDVQITVGSTFAPQFTTSWMNVQNTAIIRQADSEPVPEPSALLAVIAGAGGLLLRRRRARKVA